MHVLCEYDVQVRVNEGEMSWHVGTTCKGKAAYSRKLFADLRLIKIRDIFKLDYGLLKWFKSSLSLSHINTSVSQTFCLRTPFVFEKQPQTLASLVK
jgi:hypothetical protein